MDVHTNMFFLLCPPHSHALHLSLLPLPQTSVTQDIVSTIQQFFASHHKGQVVFGMDTLGKESLLCQWVTQEMDGRREGEGGEGERRGGGEKEGGGGGGRLRVGGRVATDRRRRGKGNNYPS